MRNPVTSKNPISSLKGDCPSRFLHIEYGAHPVCDVIDKLEKIPVILPSNEKVYLFKRNSREN